MFKINLLSRKVLLAVLVLVVTLTSFPMTGAHAAGLEEEKNPPQPGNTRLETIWARELAAYDRLLDGALEQAYRDLYHTRTGIGRDVYSNLREIRIDMARLTDELENITKFFGDWHLARIYQQVGQRFHLADWNRIINEKLQTLADLYHLLQQDRNNFWMVVLESTIVGLFIIDLALLIWGR